MYPTEGTHLPELFVRNAEALCIEFTGWPVPLFAGATTVLPGAEVLADAGARESITKHELFERS